MTSFKTDKIIGNLKLFLLIASLFCYSSIYAAVIFGEHYTNSGKFVDLGGLDWLSLDETSGVSRTSVEDGSAGNWLSDGWRYSTRTETEALLDSLWGGTTEGYYWDNFDGASWFMNNFGALWTYTNHLDRNISETHFFFGNQGECTPSSTYSCIGSVRLDVDPKSTSPYLSYGWFVDGFGLSIGSSKPINEAYILRSSQDQFNQASLLVRTHVTVPEPSIIPLLIIGIIGFAVILRQRKFASINQLSG